MTLHKVSRGEDFSPFCANRLKSPFTKGFQDWMRPKFEEYPVKIGEVEVMVRGQFWQCEITGEKVQDETQLESSLEAAKLAAVSDKPVLFYHTKAWKI